MSKRPITLGEIADMAGRFGAEFLDRRGDKEAAKAVEKLRELVRTGELAQIGKALGHLARHADGKGKPRFYVAAQLADGDRADLVADALAGRGFAQTYRWTAHGSAAGMDAAGRARIAVAELAGVADADFLVALLPGGNGTHVEIGAALALDRVVVAWAETEAGWTGGNGYECVFYSHPNVVRIVCPLEQLPRRVEAAYRALVEAQQGAGGGAGT